MCFKTLEHTSFHNCLEYLQKIVVFLEHNEEGVAVNIVPILQMQTLRQDGVKLKLDWENRS